MGETWLGIAIGMSALAVALTMRIAHYWLEWRRSQRLRHLDHRDCWSVAYGTRIAHRAIRVGRGECRSAGGPSSREKRAVG